jgi:hypothetical protein
MGTTDTEFDQAIESFSAPVQSLARDARKLIHRILPQVVEVAWVQQKTIGFGTGIKKIPNTSVGSCPPQSTYHWASTTVLNCLIPRICWKARASFTGT